MSQDEILPSEEFELTANSLGAHIETHGQFILRTLTYLTVNSQDDSHCELTKCPQNELSVSFNVS